MNLRPGIDTKPADFALMAKVNIPFNDRDRLIHALEALQMVLVEKLSPDRTHGKTSDLDGSRPAFVVADHSLNILCAFGLRFFLGPLEERGEEEPVPNFPPGGTFKVRTPTRFNMLDRHVPLYLRTMSAQGDRDWLGKRLNQPADSETVGGAYKRWLSDSESDLFINVESNNRFLAIDAWDAIRKAFIEPFGLQIISLQEGLNRGDQRDHTGYFDGIANLQEKIDSDPSSYRQMIHLPAAAPSYPGEPDWSRDDPMYDGGTYMVHRKYRENLDKWFSNDFEVKDPSGCPFKGFQARQHAVGRDQESGKVISRFDDTLLERERDSAEVNLSYNESHVLKSRGGYVAPFKGPFPPLKTGETNVFSTQNIRIRRRGFNYSEIDPSTGRVEYGLHFICFQNNIQQLGFEFINNIWLLNPLFRRAIDGLFNLDAGIVEPLDGCYYFVPPPHRKFPGDVFFE